MDATRPKPLVIGIGGCSGAGKTTLASELARRLDATLFPLDAYYRDLPQLPLDSRHQRNFDHPDSFDAELIVEHVRALAAGEPIQRPVYDRKTHSRAAGVSSPVVPSSWVIVEGILALHYPDLPPLYAFSIYMSAPTEICLARRIERYARERGWTEEAVREQFDAAVQPMAERYILPSAARASMIVDGTAALAVSVEQVLKRVAGASEKKAKILHSQGLRTVSPAKS